MLPRHVLAMIGGDGYQPDHQHAGGASSEAEYMDLKVRVLSAPRAAAYQPHAHEVAISIRGSTERPTVLSPRFGDVLTLVFEDTGTFAVYAAQGADNLESITAEQADAVAAFVVKHRTAKALVVHCAAGVSRSRSLAAAACDILELPYHWTVVNDDVYRTVSHAFRHMPGRCHLNAIIEC